MLQGSIPWCIRFLLILSANLCWPVGQAAESPRAALDCFVDGTGSASAYLFLGALVPAPDALIDDLGRALGTGARDPVVEVDEEKKVVTCAIRSQAHYWAHHYHVQGEIHLVPLLPILRTVGVTQIELRLTHPRAAFSRCVPLSLATTDAPSTWIDYSGRLSLEPTQTVRFDFGYSGADIARAEGPLVLLMLVPLFWALLRQRPSTCADGIKAKTRMQAGSVTGRRSLHHITETAARLGLAFLIAWVLWGWLVEALRADVVLCFLAGLVHPLERTLGVVVLVALVPLMVFGVATLIQRVRHPGWTTLDAMNWLAWVVPATLAAVGLSTWRETGAAAARLWWLAAAASTAVILGQRAWICAPAGSNRLAAWLDGRRRARLASIQQWWLATVILVGVPVMVAWGIRHFRIEQPASVMAAGVGLATALAGLRGLRSFAARRRTVQPVASGTSASVDSIETTARTHQASGAPRAVLALAGVVIQVGLAWLTCMLLELPWDLEHGDEGLFALACVTVAALVEGFVKARPEQDKL